MDFEKLKSSYILSIQSGLLAGVGYEDIKNANKVINHFCKYYIDAGVSNEAERAEMKHELDMIDSRIYQFEQVRKDLEPGSMSDKIFGLDTRVYRPL